MAELKGRRLALDDGGRPLVDDGGRLVYVDAGAGTEDPEALLAGQGVHVPAPEALDPAEVDPENVPPFVTG